MFKGKSLRGGEGWDSSMSQKISQYVQVMKDKSETGGQRRVSNVQLNHCRRKLYPITDQIASPPATSAT
jgi:hypothetical protein